MNLAFKSIEEILKLIQNKEITSREVWEYFLGRIKKHDSKIGAFTLTNENGLNQNGGLLAGIPMGIKDIFCERGVHTTCGSKMLENFIPPYESTVTKNLKEAGMSSIGKCNMDEFAMGSSTENSALQKTYNPWDLTRIPGGSSGGSAAAVAAGLVPASLGTDTGGSIRQPASLCGVVGFKPSYGRSSRFGAMAMSSSLDCPGTFTRTVKDASLLYEIMNGEDPQESTTIKGKHSINPIIWEKKTLQGIKLGVPREYFEEGLDLGVKETIQKAITDLKSLGAEIVEVSLPMTRYAMAVYYIICPAEVSSNLARLDGIRYGHSSQKGHENIDEFYIANRGEGLGSEPKRRSILGSYVLSAGFYDAYFKKASQVRTLIIRDFDDAFIKVDAIICPVSPSVAWKAGEKTDDPIKMYLSDAFSIPASLAGLPGISVPCGFAKSEDAEGKLLPVGLQILTPRLEEERLFEIAHVYEQSTKWFEKMIPAGFED